MYFLPNIEIVNRRNCNGSYYNDNTNGGITLAYRPINDKGVLDKVTSFQVAYAFCRVGDHFSKKIGARIAVDKLLDYKPVIFNINHFRNTLNYPNIRNMFDWSVVTDFSYIHITLIVDTMIQYGSLLKNYPQDVMVKI